MLIGDARLFRIHETVIQNIKPTEFFPKYDAKVFQAHMEHLGPLHYDRNQDTLHLSIHSWLVRTNHHLILIDSCIGNDKDRMPRTHWHLLNTPFLDNMRTFGVDPSDIDFVMCTHMHADHIGWNTVTSDGRWVPTFPNARYLFGRIEYDYWLKNPSKDRVLRNAVEVSILPVVSSGQAEFIEDGYELDDQCIIRLLPGHTPGNLAVFIKSQEAEGVFAGDIVHHPVQIYEPDWSTSACTDPCSAASSRFKVLDYCAQSESLLVPAHFCPPHVGFVRKVDDHFVFEWI